MMMADSQQPPAFGRQGLAWPVRDVGPTGQACATHGGGLAVAMMAGAENDTPIRTGDDRDTDVGVVVAVKPKLQKPSLYKVLLLNDDYTPMEFVVHVLQKFFRKSLDEATQIMLHVHKRGVGVCGVYTYEVAETKATQVMDLAQREQHPLQLRLEKE